MEPIQVPGSARGLGVKPPDRNPMPVKLVAGPSAAGSIVITAEYVPPFLGVILQQGFPRDIPSTSFSVDTLTLGTYTGGTWITGQPAGFFQCEVSYEWSFGAVTIGSAPAPGSPDLIAIPGGDSTPVNLVEVTCITREYDPSHGIVASSAYGTYLAHSSTGNIRPCPATVVNVLCSADLRVYHMTYRWSARYLGPN